MKATKKRDGITEKIDTNTRMVSYEGEFIKGQFHGDETLIYFNVRVLWYVER
jgi:hypothetical protein